MDVRDWLSLQARDEARGRGVFWAGRVALIGVTLSAVALFLERAGVDLPWLALPAPASGGIAGKFLGWIALSTAGLRQAALLAAGVFALALGLRFALVPALRRPAGVVAARIDARLSTDRFAAALEAAGPLRPVVERAAWSARPRDGFLAPVRGRRTLRTLNLLALALLFGIALLPGVAPGEPGQAPVLGAPDPGRRENALRLVLTGPVGTLAAGDPILLAVDATLSRAPSRDLDLPVTFVVDDTIPIESGTSLFLPAGGDGRDSIRFDLLPRLPRLQPGEHRVHARAGGARSNEWTFRIEGDAGGGGAPEPKPDPPKEPKPAPQGGATPPPDLRPRFVEPLVREGEKVEKRARVPIEVPGGGAPRESTIEEAWPELERRREAALNRAGLSPAARELVRRYFEELRPAEEGE